MIKSISLAAIFGAVAAQGQTTCNALKPFLSFLEVPNTPSRRFAPQSAPQYDFSKLDQIVSKSGVTLTGVGFPKAKGYSLDEVHRQLEARKGEVFRTFAHLGYLLSHPKPQYSTVQCTESGDRLIANLPTWYKLTFQNTQGRITLLSIEDLNAGD